MAANLGSELFVSFKKILKVTYIRLLFWQSISASTHTNYLTWFLKSFALFSLCEGGVFYTSWPDCQIILWLFSIKFSCSVSRSFLILRWTGTQILQLHQFLSTVNSNKFQITDLLYWCFFLATSTRAAYSTAITLAVNYFHKLNSFNLLNSDPRKLSLSYLNHLRRGSADY